MSKPDPAVIAALATQPDALAAYMAAFTDADDTPATEAKADKSPAKRVVIPTTSVPRPGDRGRVTFTQAAQSPGGKSSPPVKYRTPRIVVQAVKPDGTQDGRYLALHTDVFEAIRAMSDDDAREMLTTGLLAS